MLDIKTIRNDQSRIEELIKRKEPDASTSLVINLDSQLRKVKLEVEELKSKRNSISKKIGELKREGEDASEIMKEVEGLGSLIHDLDEKSRELDSQFTHELASLPNLPMEDVKISHDVEDNVCIKEVGKKTEFSFSFKNHLELNEDLNLFDFKRGAKVSGSGWPVYRGMGARLEWALINYMLDCNIKNGFTQWIPPLVARPEILYGSGQLPKFGDQVFRLKDEHFDLYMIPTAEVILNGLHYDEILTEEELPLKYTAYTPCFRREAGAAGSQERGLIRVHQFNKVELFCFTKPEDSPKMFDEMVSTAEEILQGLGLHYRNMLLVTGDMSFASARTVDIEVWLPGQDRYYEVSSISNCTDYQARRSQIRYRKKGEKPELLHTLNGSSLATSRLMVALLENNQNADGSINIPEVLQKYLGGISKLEPQETSPAMS
ncbi:MAG: seryl-tRNA synthetase [Chlamydiales bacterium]|jgi:seryl-tRNA synthetase